MKNKDLSCGNIKKQLLSMTWPMMFGMVGMVIFNLVDTYFIGKLGVKELAAIGFTFPVIMFVNSVALGIGIGTSSLMSRNIISQNKSTVKQMASRSLLLGILNVIVVIIIGELTIEPLFKIIGADDSLIPMIKDYMIIWYTGVIFVVIPMIGNNIVRATGNTLIPGMLMVLSATINAILDPFLIFGLGPFPEMGIKGAALATVIGRSMGLLFILTVLIKKYDLLTIRLGKVREILITWGKVLYIAGPATITILVSPISMGVITNLLAKYGEYAVAGFGVAVKVETFALMAINALSSVLVIFSGQNFSKFRYDRIFKALKYSSLFCFFWGIFIFVLSHIFADTIAEIFSKDFQVITVIKNYIKIISLSYVFLGFLSISVSIFNGINKPLPSVLFSSFRMIGAYIPLAFLGSWLLGLAGIFWAAFVTNISIGIITIIWLNKTLKIMTKRT
ncbi:MAG: MATE family efflux transporter [Candidatus Marinimicrobia bacterium]|nr:MATE family efflux transporter [Candidatus Neomarinimicrobiota bacterium]